MTQQQNTKESSGIYSKEKSGNISFLDALTRCKPIEKSLAEAPTEKTLRWYDLTAYGIAATVGSGIYVTVGQVAKDSAGPAVIFSTMIAGMLSLLTGICYLEFASALPISGSGTLIGVGFSYINNLGYAYFYTLMGEFLGWFIGWNLTLEYGFAAALIAEGWTTYLISLLESLGLRIPSWTYAITPFGVDSMFRVNIIAGLIILLIGAVVSRGARFGTMITNTITVVNLSTILLVIAAGGFFIKPSNWKPFVPSFTGVFHGGSRMFFSFIGYDTVSTLAAEAVNPSRDIPISILLTVAVATGLYMLVGLVITGMVPFSQLDDRNPLTQAFVAVGASWAFYLIAVLALLMMAATMFACLVGQPKIFQAIAKDGLMPSAFAKENSVGTPMFSVTVSTLMLACVAAFINGDSIADLVTFGTLFAMSTLCAGVLIVRFKQVPGIRSNGTRMTVVYLAGSLLTCCLYQKIALPIVVSIFTLFVVAPFFALSFYFMRYSKQLTSKSSSFSCPAMPIIPCIAIFANSFTMMMTPTPIGHVIGQFAVWTLLGFSIYFFYGIKNSHLGKSGASRIL